MALRSVAWRPTRHLAFPAGIARASAAPFAVVAAAAMLAGFVAYAGYAALLAPLYVTAVVGAIARPRQAAFVLAAVAAIIEPSAIDFTKPLSFALYDWTPAVRRILPLTLSPFELLLLVICASLYARPVVPGARRLPGLVWAVPLVLALGFVYGVRRGGELHLGYNEARGLLYGCVAFLIAARIGIDHGAVIRRVVVVGGVGLALVAIARYLFYLRNGAVVISSEAAYAHEDAALLGIAFVAGCAWFMRARSLGERAAWAAFDSLILVAMLSAGRRSSFLVLFVGAVIMVWLMLPRRPVVVVAALIPVVAFGSVYMAAYWNKEYGALAQPARAVRSQFDPSARDESSDVYRTIEAWDVRQTIDYNPAFGVGFGRPFVPIRPLPALDSFWPLQLYTPHTNVLWLWLKMGIVGVSVFLAMWVLALKRCLVAFRTVPRGSPVPILPLILACALVMYLAYARVDLALVGTRSMAPLAVVVALALRLPGPEQAAENEAER